MADIFSQFTTETRDAIDAYVAEVASELSIMGGSERAEALSDVAAFFAEQLAQDATPADVEAAASQLGTPHDFVVGLSAALGAGPKGYSAGAVSAQSQDARTVRAGRLLGIPFDVRVPTASRIAERWWDPANPHIFVPRVFGMGWDVNFGAVAVSLGLMRPDDEDEPFGAVPDRAFVFAMLVPVAFTAFIVGVALATAGRLPADLPAHWDIVGRPDGFWSKGAVLAFDLTLAALPTAYAVFSVVARRSRLERAASIALASLMGVLAAGFYAASVLWAMGVLVPYLSVAMIVASLAAPFAQLTTLARIGRSEDMRRDLSGFDRKDAR